MGDWSSHYKRGLTSIESRDFAAAVLEFSECIRVKPTDAHNYYNRGRAYVQLGEIDSAIADFNKALSIDSKYARAYYSRSVLLSFLGRHEAAVEDLKHAVNWGGRECIIDAHYGLSVVYDALGMPDEANKCREASINMLGGDNQSQAHVDETVRSLRNVWHSQLPSSGGVRKKRWWRFW